MKKIFLLLSCGMLCAQAVQSQNADNLYLRGTTMGFDYQAATFIIDTARLSSQFNRALLMWAANTGGSDVTRQAISLDQVDSLGNPLTEHINVQAGVPYRSMQPKAIIRSQFGKFYYVLARVINSPNRINNLVVNSSAYVLKLDDDFNLVWSSKIHFNTVNATTAAALIEYNDILETRDGNVALVGRYGASNTQQHALQFAKLNGATGANMWWFWYYLWNCNANGLSLEEATNGELVATGYIERCATSSVANFRQLLFARVSALGAPIQFSRYSRKPGEDVSGDKINRFQTDVPVGAPTDPDDNDRFFITGFVVVDDPTGTSDILHRQNLIIDINQRGGIINAAHWGDLGNEEANDHIFTRIEVPNTNLYEVNVTGNTNSYGEPQAHISVLVYNANATTNGFNLRRYDVIRNFYPSGQRYISRRGLEIKYAGQRKFAILLNSTWPNGTPVYNHEVTNVFIRDYAIDQPEDQTCYFPKTPPTVAIKFDKEDTVAVRKNPPYRIYPENWRRYNPIVKKLDCGPLWQIFPKQAARRTIRPGGQYRGPGDVVPTTFFPYPPYFPLPPIWTPILPISPLKANAINVQQLSQSGSGMLYPNPANNEVNLLIDEAMMKRGTPITIGLYTPDMKLVRSSFANGKPLQRIAVNNLLPGIYLIQVQQAGKQRTYRFIKQ